MQTNRDFYQIYAASNDCSVRLYNPKCRPELCPRCRHSRRNRDPHAYPWEQNCCVSWLNAPHDQPLDVREPWSPQPPEAEPNPL